MAGKSPFSGIEDHQVIHSVSDFTMPSDIDSQPWSFVANSRASKWGWDLMTIPSGTSAYCLPSVGSHWGEPFPRAIVPITAQGDQRVRWSSQNINSEPIENPLAEHQPRQISYLVTGFYEDIPRYAISPTIVSIGASTAVSRDKSRQKSKKKKNTKRTKKNREPSQSEHDQGLEGSRLQRGAKGIERSNGSNDLSEESNVSGGSRNPEATPFCSTSNVPENVQSTGIVSASANTQYSGRAGYLSSGKRTDGLITKGCEKVSFAKKKKIK